MGFKVNFYNFPKRRNSTASPSGKGAEYECTLKANSSIIRPVIVISYNPSTPDGALNYNYAYIAKFGRYYYVSDLAFVDGNWAISLNCDVLATYKSEIAGTTAYIERAAHKGNGALIDNYYPAIANVKRETLSPTDEIFTNLQKSGRYVVGVIGAGSDNGAVSYYVMGSSSFQAFSNYLLNNIQWMDLDFDELGEGLSKALINPYQYVVSCKWFPFSAVPIENSSLTSLPYGWWTVSGVACNRIKDNPVFVSETTFSLSAHPQVNRGEYLNSQPYTRRTLYFPPFGQIPIDCTKLIGASTLSIKVRVDCITGRATLDIFAVQSTPLVSLLIGRYTGDVGVDIQIAQMAIDYVGDTTNMVSNLSGMIGSFASGNIASGISAIGASVSSLTSLMYPEMHTSGTNGSFSEYAIKPTLTTLFTYVADENTEDFGKPLCERSLISSMVSGYVKCNGASVSMAGTEEERIEVNAHVNGGFYYE